MDSAGSAREVDFARIQGLVDWISHTDDVRAMTVGIKAIEAILENNPHFGQLRGFMDSLNMIREAREVLQAREIGIFARSLYSVPKPPPLQHQMELSATQQRPLKRRGVSTPRPRNSSLSTSSSDYCSPASFLAAMWSEEESDSTSPSLPTTANISAPISRGKRRQHRQRKVPPPEPRTSPLQTPLVSVSDTEQFTGSEGPRSDYVMAEKKKTASLETKISHLGNLKDCSPHAPPSHTHAKNCGNSVPFEPGLINSMSASSEDVKSEIINSEIVFPKAAQPEAHLAAQPPEAPFSPLPSLQSSVRSATQLPLAPLSTLPPVSLPPQPLLHSAIQAATQSIIQPIALPLRHSVAEPLAARPAADSATSPPVTPPPQPSLQSPVPVQSPAVQPSPVQSPAVQPSPVQSPAVQPSPVQSPAVQPSPVQSPTSPPLAAKLPPEPLAQVPVAAQSPSQRHISSPGPLHIQPRVPIPSGSTATLAGSSDEFILHSAAPTPPPAGGSEGPVQQPVSTGGSKGPLRPAAPPPPATTPAAASSASSASPGPASASTSSGPASAPSPSSPAAASESSASPGPARASASPAAASSSAASPTPTPAAVSPTPSPAAPPSPASTPSPAAPFSSGPAFEPSASSSPGPASASASPPTPGPASASASTLPGPVAATPPSGPASSSPTPTKPRPVRPTLESRRRLPRGRPPDPLCCRRRLPRGRPPDPLCCRRRLLRGRPPDPLCCHFSRGRPPELTCVWTACLGSGVSCALLLFSVPCPPSWTPAARPGLFSVWFCFLCLGCLVPALKGGVLSGSWVP
ncbi:proline-rich protein 36-like [Oreochromis niloticus]|uniref:proline-rich protein 36-like n=1 Tax=Oreochromis niloticus TaxID=8128 RepID=UPI000DF3C7CA|nr:proline-rich protein 36-like [Oreochromis niloticus]